MPASTRTSVFISYSHADSQWLRLLNTHLKPLIRDQKLEIWSDQKIRKGERWRDRIRRQMAMARVGIFLVSADFLASDFIHAEELPPLLKAANQEGATLLTIIVRPCGGAFQDSPLSQLQSMNGPQSPLSGMTRTQREQVMVDVYNELRDLFRTPATPRPAKHKPASTVSKVTPKKRPTPATPKTVAPKAVQPRAASQKAAAAKPETAVSKAKTAKTPSPSTARRKPVGTSKPATSKKVSTTAKDAPKTSALNSGSATKAARKPTASRPATTRAKKK
jgi:hypothetical protein